MCAVIRTICSKSSKPTQFLCKCCGSTLWSSCLPTDLPPQPSHIQSYTSSLHSQVWLRNLSAHPPVHLISSLNVQQDPTENTFTCDIAFFLYFILFLSQQWQFPIQLLKFPLLLPVSVSALFSSWSLNSPYIVPKHLNCHPFAIIAPTERLFSEAFYMSLP